MLVEFSVKNFRSFRDRSELSMVASSDQTNRHTHVSSTKYKAIPGVLHSAAIYGANASGKSNLVRALQLYRGIINDSATLKPEQKFNIQQFALDPESMRSPVEFESTFILDNTRYQFGFTATSSRILSEWLVVYATSQPQTWFEREYDEKAGVYRYKYSSFFKGAKSTWEESTRQNALYLSTAVQLNSEQLLPIFNWLTQDIFIIENGGVPNFQSTVDHVRHLGSSKVKNFLTDADISISDIEIVKRSGFSQSFTFDVATGDVVNNREEREFLVPLFEHSSTTGRAKFEIGDESEGTRKLFSFAGPLFDIFEGGKTLVVDELDRSLHTLLVRKLVEMFHDPSVNVNGAQLLFTTHDTALLEGDLLRRDQIWFTEKEVDSSSTLIPLSDFSPRLREAIHRGYLSGRYGGIPLASQLKG